MTKRLNDPSRACGALRALGAVALAGLLQATAHAQSAPPVALPGPYPVGCSNLEQDFARVPQGETAESYWRGLATEEGERYVTDLLADPANALVTTFVAPADGSLYSRWAGRTLTYANLVCYPTLASNDRADYLLPQGGVIPRMQRGAEEPILGVNGRLPVLLFSHGYAGSPLSSSYLEALVAFASHGYVVAAPFHGDLRYSIYSPVEWDPPPLYVPVWEEFVAMQATRPRSLSAALDLLASHPHWGGRVDLGRVAGFGVSQGGESLMLMGGAALTHTLALESKVVGRDARLKASVGYIPYFGTDGIPAFGQDQVGASGAAVPYLAISGADDPLASIERVEQAFSRMSATHLLVSLQGGHDLFPSTAADIYTWALAFLAAYDLGDPGSRTWLAGTTSVAGGLDDRKLRYMEAGGGNSDVRTTVEYYHAGLDHYFITADLPEATALDAGSPPGWQRTGYAFRTWVTGRGPGQDACRFFGTPGVGPSSHFYTIDAHECEITRGLPAWTFESLAFRAVPVTGPCASGQLAVTRLYNNGMGGQANHRYLTDEAEIGRMTSRGWLVEGQVFCVPQ
jgi:hypothetical protein